MAITNKLNSTIEELPLTTTGEPTDQLTPEENEDDTDLDDDDLTDDETDTDDADFDDATIADEEEDLDDDEVKRLFPGEDDYTEDEDDVDEDEEPYEGIRHGDEEEEGLVDDNMSGMPVVPSPS